MARLHIDYLNRNVCKLMELNRVIKFLLIVIMLMPVYGFVRPIQKMTATLEYQVKAVFLFNFTQFVEWPENAFTQNDSPFIIGILGEDPFGDYLDMIVKDEKINGHVLKIQRFTKSEDIKTCHILFINQTEKSQLRNILQNLNDRSILTVSDMANFAKQGGMIRFLTENNKTKIRINLEVTKNASLTVSSKLLRLSEIVSTSK